MNSLVYKTGPVGDATLRDEAVTTLPNHPVVESLSAARDSGETMARDARFWDRLAEKYSRQPIKDEAAYQRKLEITRGYLRPDMEVLEFGCGTGSTAILHAPLVKHIRAIDISSNMLDIGRRKARAANIENITFQHASFDEFDAVDGTFDMVLGLSILHLLNDRDEAIAKVKRMLKPGGVFVTSTVCLGDKMNWFRFVGPVGRFLGLLPMLRIFTKRQLMESFIRAGLTIDHEWQPEGSMGVFVVAKKAA